jgi:hypothetical protein
MRSILGASCGAGMLFGERPVRSLALDTDSAMLVRGSSGVPVLLRMPGEISLMSPPAPAPRLPPRLLVERLMLCCSGDWMAG